LLHCLSLPWGLQAEVQLFHPLAVWPLAVWSWFVPQVAKQEGEYLANVLVSGQWDQQQSTFSLPQKAEPFK